MQLLDLFFHIRLVLTVTDEHQHCVLIPFSHFRKNTDQILMIFLITETSHMSQYKSIFRNRKLLSDLTLRLFIKCKLLQIHTVFQDFQFVIYDCLRVFPLTGYHRAGTVVRRCTHDIWVRRHPGQTVF